MNDSNEPSKRDPEDGQPRETPFSYGLDLPVAPDWFSEEPEGSWEAGYELSLEALRSALTQPEVWLARDREMVAAEFKMS